MKKKSTSSNKEISKSTRVRMEKMQKEAYLREQIKFYANVTWR